ncbi:hypothetical protein CVT26_014645 [Gymnopilus dilepis]|uniref:DUF6534 domain-containing protein n=1 Tax=Gymnopilus dilepis TaxID=231916 RepID=A0A409W3I5_9AGAR|nr:hypothetical protein CVT26_014645 [Gymnopilus dilepis]
MGSPLDSTFGMWLVIVFIQTLLQGCGMLQAWLFFHWYSKDHWAIKAMARIRSFNAFPNIVNHDNLSEIYRLSETFQIVVLFQVTYFYFIDNFGNVPGLLTIHWQDSAQLIGTYLSAFIVQMYFAYCVYTLEKTNKIAAGIITTLAVVQIGSGIAQVVVTSKLTSFTELDSSKPYTTLEAASACLCDIMITFFLVRSLGKHRGEIRSTNSLLTNLMIFAVNRGVLTAICAALNLILFIAIPNTFYFFIGLDLSGKLYMNSALATLNSRQYIVKKSTTGGTGNWSAIQMDTLANSVTKTPSTNEDQHVRVLVSKQSEIHQDMKSTFVDGMV